MVDAKSEDNQYTVWEFRVRAGRLPEFERFYSGAGGPWEQLFRKSPGFRGMVLLRNTKDPLHFLTIDSWDTVVAQVAMRAEFRDEYAGLDQACEELTESETHVGVFEDWPFRGSKTSATLITPVPDGRNCSSGRRNVLPGFPSPERCQKRCVVGVSRVIKPLERQRKLWLCL